MNSTNNQQSALDQYRKEMVSVRANLKPGELNVDTSPNGSGKSTANVELLKQIGTGVVAVPARPNVDETVQFLKEQGLSAAGIPD